MRPHGTGTFEDPSSTAEPSRHRTIGSVRWFSKLVPFLVSLVLSVLGAELSARAFWRLRYGVPFTDPGRILYAFYPQLRKIDAARPSQRDWTFNILLLGESPLHRDWGEVEQSLREQLSHAGHRNVRIFNLASPAHNSRDSRLKYAALGDARFDLVILYDGINDTRANNAPPAIFKRDYSHYAWYEIVNTLATYHRKTSFALPYTLRYIAIRTRQILTRERYIPRDQPRPDWVRYGRDFRSAESFRDNVSAILDLAAQRGDRVVLMTFATSPPAELPMGTGPEPPRNGVAAIPIESWGARDQVLATVARNNQVLRDLAAQHRNVRLVDEATLMAGNPIYFNDPCHLTVVGSSKFVEYLLTDLLPVWPDPARLDHWH